MKRENYYKPNRTLDILKHQLDIVVEVWDLIGETKQPSDRWLGAYFHRNKKKFGSRDRRFIAETIYSIFRNMTFYQCWIEELFIPKRNRTWVLALFAAMREGFIFEKFAHQFIKSKMKLQVETDDLLYALNAIATQKLPSSLSELAFEEKCSVAYSIPEWLIARWQKVLKKQDSLKENLKALSERPPVAVRVNLLKTNRESLIHAFEKEGFESEPSLYSNTGVVLKERANLFGLEIFKQGYFEIQDIGSQVLCDCMDPKPTEIIWDVCAGGGGKSLALGALMENKGRLIATDIRESKIVALKKRAKRAGVFNIFPADITRLEDSKIMKKKVDKILVDAPCSGSGTLRRNPDAKWKFNPEMFSDFHAEQLKIMKSSIKYLRDGGYLYYATCSFDYEENEGVIKDFLTEDSSFKVVSLKSALAASAPDSGLVKSALTKEGFLRLSPYPHGTDGFFLACLQKQ